jgi:squalene synthase HpnC
MMAPAEPAVARTPPALPPPEAILARAAGENFPVAARFLPAAVRSDLMAIYGFARLVDDLGDEAPGDRLAHLAWLEGEVDLAFEGRPHHPLLERLAGTIRRRAMPRAPFDRLIEANRQDQRVARYATFGDLLAYCALSADPVGVLVLHVFGAATPERVRLSDAVCTGLQLVEHWQDVREDAQRGRVYVPLEDLDAFGVAEEDLLRTAPTDAFRRLMAFEVRRARELLLRGAPLAGSLPGRGGVAIAGFAGGGLAALRAIDEADFDVLGRSPRPTKARRLAETAGVLRSSGWRP